MRRRLGFETLWWSSFNNLVKISVVSFFRQLRIDGRIWRGEESEYGKTVGVW